MAAATRLHHHTYRIRNTSSAIFTPAAIRSLEIYTVIRQRVPDAASSLGHSLDLIYPHIAIKVKQCRWVPRVNTDHRSIRHATRLDDTPSDNYSICILCACTGSHPNASRRRAAVPASRKEEVVVVVAARRWGLPPQRWAIPQHTRSRR